MTDEIRVVAPGEWVAAVAAAKAAGFVWFDFLGGVDEIGRADEIRVVLRLARAREGVRLEVRLDREAPRLDTISGLFAGAAWHERETAEEFGVEFIGGDPRRLLQREPGLWPLRKDRVLGARAALPWPGAKEPGDDGAPSRRRMVPPGVPDPEIWGDRDPAAEEPTAEEIAESARGGQVRRRRA